jgi:hypothetical protein
MRCGRQNNEINFYKFDVPVSVHRKYISKVQPTRFNVNRNKQIEKTLHLVGCTLEIQISTNRLWIRFIWVRLRFSGGFW